MPSKTYGKPADIHNTINDIREIVLNQVIVATGLVTPNLSQY